MNRQHRYHQQALGGVPGAEPTSYSPNTIKPAPPMQGQLALDGAVLGPLFDQQQAPPKAGQEQ